MSSGAIIGVSINDAAPDHRRGHYGRRVLLAGLNTCKLRVHRPNQHYADRMRQYAIFVDDILAGKISRGSVLELDISSGEHIVGAKIDWGRARPLTVNAAPGQVIEIEVANRWGALRSLWAITFGSGSYLSLQQTSP